MDLCTVSGALMLEQLLTNGLQYAGYLFQALLLGVLVARGHLKRLAGLCLYLGLFLLLDAAARLYTLLHYGRGSRQYFYVYWLTDVVLTVLAFALVCAFFRRACADDEKMWHQLRPVLGFVFLLLAAISYLMIANRLHNYTELYYWIYQFQQNTYFACLVLTTLLYIMIQRSEVRDEELAMLVCGMGIQFAAPTAGLAGDALLPRFNHQSMVFFLSHLDQLCMLGMLFTWWYAITKLSHEATVRANVPALARRRVESFSEV
ncbi:MAG: hypothetical protein ACLQOO_21650 [Terriglobia bacterium]